ncbi:MAG: hypothetical protein HYX71_00900 [Opitutae bacterium]|nr:hypothetical protein [Opitutae bacterium]
MRAATAALLLIGRERLARGKRDDLIQRSLADCREDSEGYKASKAVWPDARESGPLANPRDVAYCRNLLLAVAALLREMTLNKRQSNSLPELDNYLVACLQHVR